MKFQLPVTQDVPVTAGSVPLRSPAGSPDRSEGSGARSVAGWPCWPSG